MQTFLRSSGSNASLPCPEIRSAADSLQVTSLEWFCRGCGSANGQPAFPGANVASSVQSISGGGSGSKLVSYNDEGTVILRSPERMYLSSTDFGLQMAPVLTADSGDYFCLVNDQRQPSVITRLLVQGEPAGHAHIIIVNLMLNDDNSAVSFFFPPSPLSILLSLSLSLSLTFRERRRTQRYVQWNHFLFMREEALEGCIHFCFFSFASSLPCHLLPFCLCVCAAFLCLAARAFTFCRPLSARHKCSFFRKVGRSVDTRKR